TLRRSRSGWTSRTKARSWAGKAWTRARQRSTRARKILGSSPSREMRVISRCHRERAHTTDSPLEFNSRWPAGHHLLTLVLFPAGVHSHEFGRSVTRNELL